MKRLSTFLALGCIIALSLTSCLKTDENNNNTGLTKAQRGQCFDAIHGEFSGEMIYPVLNNELNTYGIPLRVLASITLPLNVHTESLCAIICRQHSIVIANMRHSFFILLFNWSSGLLP